MAGKWEIKEEALLSAPALKMCVWGLKQSCCAKVDTVMLSDVVPIFLLKLMF